ncbi:MAG: response regulator [Bacteroidetes bacterium]|nr:response regulator [Bacteroidota bacterium]
MKENKMILMVEDNPSDIELTKRALRGNNILNDIVVVEDGQEALDYLFGTGVHAGRDLTKMPSVILLDLKMPRVNGLEVLQRVRSDPRTKRLPVVVLTSSQEDEDIIRSYDFGANSYIRKPVDFIRFADAISHLSLYWLLINEPPPK